MSEQLCREKLSKVLQNRAIKRILVVGDKNSKGDYIKSSLTVIIDSGDVIKGLSLAKLQSEIEALMETKITLYELIELQYDERLKEKITKTKPLVITR